MQAFTTDPPHSPGRAGRGGHPVTPTRTGRGRGRAHTLGGQVNLGALPQGLAAGISARTAKNYISQHALPQPLPAEDYDSQHTLRVRALRQSAAPRGARRDL